MRVPSCDQRGSLQSVSGELPVSGVSAGLAATDRSLVPYGALVATFHTGIGCLAGPSVLYFTVKLFAAS